jgi:alpha-L-fucosidase
MKSLKECLQTLVLCAGGDGNLLFNVGPMPDGRIEPRQVERLKEMGAWLAKNGEAIYGTRGGPWRPTKALASTRRGNTVFLHVLRWDGDSVTLPDVPRKVTKASLLGGGPAEVRQTDGKLTVSAPPAQRDAVDTVVRLELDGSALDVPVLAQAATVKATASNVFMKLAEEYGPDMAFDNDSGSRWATDQGTKQAWIAADLGRPLAIQRVRIEEAEGYTGRVKKFEFQCRDGAGWRTLFAGTELGGWFQKQFPPVTAQEFRLNILEATEGPTIAEIEFFER